MVQTSSDSTTGSAGRNVKTVYWADGTTTFSADTSTSLDVTTGATSSDVVTSSGSNISFSNTYGSGVSAAYKSCILSAEEDIQAHWTCSTAITINLDFIGSALGQNGTLASNSFYVNDYSYTALKNALAANDGGSVYAQDAVAALPSSNPAGSATWSLPQAYAQMLGLASSNSADTVTLNTSYSWNYGQDVIDTLEHEISEGAMGRIGGLGDQNSFWSTMDLFRYTSAGVADYQDGRDGATTYFSYNGGATLSTLSFNNQYNSLGNKVNGGDTADFTQQDVFGTGSPGETNVLSQTDIEIMDSLGWTPNTAQTASNTLYDFYYVYPDGSYYYGTVADDGTYGYAVGETVNGTTKGYYYIYASAGSTSEAAGTVSDTSYYDVFTGTTYTPYYHANQSYSGTTGLNTDFDYIFSNNVYQSFGYGGAYEPDATMLTEPKSTLPVASGGTATVSHAFLWSYDYNTGTTAISGNSTDIVYTVSTPLHGVLLVDGAAANSFTQADVDNGRVQYRNSGDGAASDQFSFTVSDPSGHQITEGFDIAVVDNTAPVVTGNYLLSVAAGDGAKLIDHLSTVALGDTPADMTYTVTSAPQHGVLLDNGVVVTSFTQADIDNGYVEYRENGDSATNDAFTFTVTDAAGQRTAPQTFNIAIDATPPSGASSVSPGAGATPTQDPIASISGLAPANPAPGSSDGTPSIVSSGTQTLAGASSTTFGSAAAIGSIGGGAPSPDSGGPTVNIALLSNYMASSFVTPSDGFGASLTTDPALLAAQPPLLTQPHA